MANNARKSHAGKSKAQRQYYTNVISELGYEQTNDESLNFENSDDFKQEFTAERKGLQKEPLDHKIGKYLKEHIVGVIVTGIGTVVLTILSLMAMTLNRESGSHETSINNIKEDIGRIEASDTKQNDSITKIRIDINGNSKEIEFINRTLDRLESSINGKTNIGE